LEEFTRHQGLTLGLVTKSDMIVRDLELLQAISHKNRLSIMVTVTTLKTELARILEPRAPRPDLRLQAVEKLARAGIRVGVNYAPVLPEITDSPADLESVVRAAANAGAKFVFANSLFLKPCAAKVFFPFLQEHFPHLVPLYEKRYSNRAFLPAAYTRRIAELVAKYRAKHGMASQGSRFKDSRREDSRFEDSRRQAPTHQPLDQTPGTQMGLFDRSAPVSFPVAKERNPLPRGQERMKS